MNPLRQRRIPGQRPAPPPQAQATAAPAPAAQPQGGGGFFQRRAAQLGSRPVRQRQNLGAGAIGGAQMQRQGQQMGGGRNMGGVARAQGAGSGVLRGQNSAVSQFMRGQSQGNVLGQRPGMPGPNGLQGGQLRGQLQGQQMGGAAMQSAAQMQQRQLQANNMLQRARALRAARGF